MEKKENKQPKQLRLTKSNIEGIENIAKIIGLDFTGTVDLIFTLVNNEPVLIADLLKKRLAINKSKTYPIMEEKIITVSQERLDEIKKQKEDYKKKK